MALQTLDPKGLRRAFKRRRKAERRQRRMERAVRFRLYVLSLAVLLAAVAALAQAFLR
jgi:hypothetical protein